MFLGADKHIAGDIHREFMLWYVVWPQKLVIFTNNTAIITTHAYV